MLLDKHRFLSHCLFLGQFTPDVGTADPAIANRPSRQLERPVILRSCLAACCVLLISQPLNFFYSFIPRATLGYPASIPLFTFSFIDSSTPLKPHLQQDLALWRNRRAATTVRCGWCSSLAPLLIEKEGACDSHVRLGSRQVP